MKDEEQEECKRQGRALAAFLLSCDPIQRELMLDAVKEVICFHCTEPKPDGGVCYCTHDE